MSSAEFAEWMAYYTLEPFGEERADLRMAVLASLIANANRDPKRRKRAYAPKDFMPQFDRPEQDWQQQLSIAEMLNAAFGGEDMRGHTR